VAAGRNSGKLVIMTVDDAAEKMLHRLQQGVQIATIGDDRTFVRQGTQTALNARRAGL
jgi:hypothetical protein